MVFMGNTKKSVAYMMKHSHFFEELPDKYIDSAFLDRLHLYNAGWESSPVRSELFTQGYGFIVDYLAEILKSLRNSDFSHAYQKYFELNAEITTRDRDGVHKTFSGLMKLLYPEAVCTKEEVRELMTFAIEGRKRVKDQLLKLDETFSPVAFTYTDTETGSTEAVLTQEERQFPSLVKPTTDAAVEAPSEASEPAVESAAKSVLESGKHITVSENAKGISFKKLFGPYLAGAKQITIQDPYICAFWQIKNLMELLQMVLQQTLVGEEVAVKLITKSDEERCVEQDDNLKKVEQSFEGTSINFSFEYAPGTTLHARSITSDTGWKISLDRGLDIFQRYDMNHLSLASTVQEERLTKAFEVTYLKTPQDEIRLAEKNTGR